MILCNNLKLREYISSIVYRKQIPESHWKRVRLHLDNPILFYSTDVESNETRYAISNSNRQNADVRHARKHDTNNMRHIKSVLYGLLPEERQ